MTNTIVIATLLLTASWERFSDTGRVMATGRRFDPVAMTCATWRYPLGTLVRVTDVHNGSEVLVRVTDRPAKDFGNRIDLSPRAFSKLNGLALGVCEVKCEVVK